MFKFYCCSDCNMVRAVIDLIKIFIVFRVYLTVLMQKNVHRVCAAGRKVNVLLKKPIF